MTEDRWPCRRCGMSFLLQKPPHVIDPELLVCECGIAYGVIRPRARRPVVCWLLRAGDARLVKGVVKLPDWATR
jgi:hypothetical protein